MKPALWSFLWFLSRCVLLLVAMSAMTARAQSFPSQPPSQAAPKPGITTVTCSASVPPDECSDFTQEFKMSVVPLFPEMNLSVSLLSPAEYKAQTDAMHETEGKTFLEQNRKCRAQYPEHVDQQTEIDYGYCLAEKFNFTNTQFLLTQRYAGKISFLRADPGTSDVGSVLISADVFDRLSIEGANANGEAVTKDLGYSGGLYLINSFTDYFVGYVESNEAAAESVELPQSVTLLMFSHRADELVNQYNQLVDKYNSLLKAAQTLASFPPTFVMPKTTIYLLPPPPPPSPTFNIHCDTMALGGSISTTDCRQQ